jgi:hypothetical protein
MKLLVKCILLVFAFNLCAKEKIQIVPVRSTPQSENVKIYIVYPEDNQIESNQKIWMQLKLRGYPLGNMTETDRGRELANSTLGQSVHVIVDNNPYFARIGPSLDPYDEEGNYYEAMYRFNLPYELSQGKHYLRVFPTRSYGESLKEPGSFAAIEFYVQNKRINNQMDLSDPYLTFNEPSGYYKIKEKQPVLLDFYLSNCSLSSDGYKVKVTIDNKIKRLIFSWIPYYIYGLKKGRHTIRLQLIDKNMKQVPGFFNDTTRTFYVY